jgi:hypothetical protein
MCFTQTHTSSGVSHLNNAHFNTFNRTQKPCALHRHEKCWEATIAGLLSEVSSQMLTQPFSRYSHPKREVKTDISYFSKMGCRRVEWWRTARVPWSIYCFLLKLAVRFWNLRQNYSCAQRHINPSRSASQGANTSCRTRFIHYVRSDCQSRHRPYINTPLQYLQHCCCRLQCG